MRIESLSDACLESVASRLFAVIDTLMSDACAGGLSYGWDMRTFRVLFPRKAKHWQRVVALCKARGIVGFTDTRLTYRHTRYHGLRKRYGKVVKLHMRTVIDIHRAG